jgi:hypothetical protein
MARAPHSEIPIYVDSLVRGEEVRVGTVGGAAKERIPVDHREVWAQLDEIPETPPVDGVGTVVLRRTGLALTAVGGNPYRFAAGADTASILNIMPRGFVAYRPTLRSATGTVVPYDPAIWIADGVQNFIEFRHRTPAELGHTPPFTIDCWVYTGLFGLPAPAPTRWFAYEQRNTGVASHEGADFPSTDAGNGVRRQLTTIVGTGPQQSKVTLSNNVLTFSSGSYKIVATSPSYSGEPEYIGNHRIIIATTAQTPATLAVGAAVIPGTNSITMYTTSFASVESILSLPDATTGIQILHQRTGGLDTVPNGFGLGVSLGGTPEIYTTVSIELL